MSAPHDLLDEWLQLVFAEGERGPCICGHEPDVFPLVTHHDPRCLVGALCRQIPPKEDTP